MRKPIFWTGLVGMLFAIPLGWYLVHLKPQRPPPVVHLEAPREQLPVLVTLPPFQLTNQDGQPFSLEQLKGHVSIVNFIFTSCPSVCPLLSQKMAGLQQRTLGLGSAVELVSFSVDPENDTPPVLKAYRARYTHDPARWTFVTGKTDAVEAAISDGFKIALTHEGRDDVDGGNGFDIVHGEKFVLVDGQGRIRGYYDKDDADLDRLVNDAARLAGHPLASKPGDAVGQR